MILAPCIIPKFFDNNGQPLAKGLLFSYVSGTTTKQTTYTDSTGGTPNTNPIVLDFRGECQLWLDTTKTYKFVLAPATDTDPPTNPFKTVDNVAGGYGGTIDWTQIVYDQTAVESDVDVTPILYYQKSFDARRYGLIGDGSHPTQDAAAWASWKSVMDNSGTVASQMDNIGWQRVESTAMGLGPSCLINLQLGAIENTAFGVTAAQHLTTGQANLALGYAALTAATTPNYTTAVGVNTMLFYTNGLGYNTTLGYGAYARGLTGSNNVAIGFESTHDNGAGNQNVAIGSETLRCGTNGVIAAPADPSNCVAVGLEALRFIYGSQNVAIGIGAMRGPDPNFGAALQNVAVGGNALRAINSGTSNVVIGDSSASLFTDGSSNQLYGSGVAATLTVGSGNHLYGLQAGGAKRAGSNSHGFGYQVLYGEDSSPITAITKAASAVITINTVSAINPFSAGQPIMVTGVSGMTQINELSGIISAIGGSSGAWTITTNINSSGFSTYTSGGFLCPNGNTAFGQTAGFQNGRRGGNTLFGYEVCKQAEAGSGNTIFGFQTGNKLNANAGGSGGELNTMMGFWAGLNATTASYNVFIGQRAGLNVTTGNDNVHIGENSGVSVSTANNTVYIGSIAGNNVSGASNVAVGYNAGSTGSAQTYTNVTSIGSNSVPNGSNQINLGDTSIATIRAQVTTITAYSDERLKKNIASLEIPDGAIEDLPIAVFEWIAENKPKGVQMGVIAQHLLAWEKKWGLEWMELVIKNDEFYEATPHKLLFPLIVHVKKQTVRMDAIEKRLAALEGDEQWKNL